MTNENDWRRKYRDVLNDLESGEERWAALEGRVRLIIGRLCLAALGRNAELDLQLRTLSDAVRVSLRPEELDELLTPLSRAIAALDDPRDGGPVHAHAPSSSAAAITESEPRIQHAISTLIDQLARMPDIRPAIHPVCDKPAAQIGADELAQALERVGHHISVQRAVLHREKAEVHKLLRQISARLDDLASHLAGDEQRQQDAKESTRELNLRVMEEMQTLNTDVQRAADLSELREQVQLRLDSIQAHLHEFRVREDSRGDIQHDRTERLRVRIAELERESHGLQQSLREEQRLALLDALTGVANRAAYDDRIELEFRRWKRDGGTVSILAWDLDRFKAINDAYGHRAGDKVLRIIGQHLARQLRETDFVARYGGEEFVMVLVGAGTTQACELANRIRLSIAELGFHFRSRPVSVTASCGITEFRGQDTPDAAFDRADRALYRAKESGRNCCVVD